jgi:hypothetical protein
MGKLYKVGEYGEMKLGEFRKNIMQYTRNNLRSIIQDSDPEIVQIAMDELTRRGEELKEGGIARLGFEKGGILVSPSIDGKRKGYRFGYDRGKGGTKVDKGTDTGDGPSQRQREQSRFEDQSYSNPNKFATKEDVREQARVGNQIKEGDFLSPATTTIGGQQFNVIPGDDRNLEERILAENIQKRIDKQNRDKFINTKTIPKKTGFKTFDATVDFVNKFLPSQITRKFYYDNVRGKTVTLPDGSVITFDEDNYDEYDALRKAGVIGAYGNTEMGQNAIDARGGGGDPTIGPITTMPVPGNPGEVLPTPPVEPDSPFILPKDRKLPFQNYFVGSDPSAAQLAYGKQMGVDPRMYGLTAFAADGGRIGYAGGGITDLRQGYFLGKIVKKIGKGVKKIAKSPFGKAALLAAGAGLLGGIGPFAGLRTSGLGKFLMGSKVPSGFIGPTKTGILQKIFLNDPRAGFSLKNINPFSTIGALSALPLVFGTGQDEDDPNKFSRGEGLDIRGIRNLVARGNLDRTQFPFMPEDFYATAADGGRIGFANGGNEDDETIRSQALSALTPYRINRSAGGGTGYAPVTMQTEGQDAIVSGDDQSGPMAQGTTLPNQMPMRSPMPMMNPMMSRGIMNPMMMRGMMNPMMARGMPMMGGRMMANEGGIMKASYGYDDAMGEAFEEFLRLKKIREIPEDMEFDEYLDQLDIDVPYSRKDRGEQRTMAQEGGMIDMGGMEKDYRNEGGFVAIGGEERADDVPARLSKNEFVFTADAVRNAGGGDIDKGAEIMENMMENLEAGGKVSKESQGLQGARAMFATQKRLGEVL